jgi:hypothetical protein
MDIKNDKLRKNNRMNIVDDKFENKKSNAYQLFYFLIYHPLSSSDFLYIF